MSKNYGKYMIFSILFFSTISIVYQIAVVQNPDFNLYDLALNLLSEFAGMIFTVLIFNEFITYRQQLTNSNKFRLLYQEMEELLKCIDFPFHTAAKKCMEDVDEDLWNSQVMNAIRDQIILSEVDDCVFPPVPWYLIFSMQGEKIMRKCENIRNQYHDILEREISNDLFYLSNNSEMLTDLRDIKKIYESDLLLGYHRPQNLGSYFACPTQRDFQVVKNLHRWLRLREKESEKQRNAGRFNPAVILVLAAIFTIGAIGYCSNGSYLSGGVFAAVTVFLCIAFIRSRRKKRH